MAAYNVAQQNPQAVQAGAQALQEAQAGTQRAGGAKVVAGAAAVGGVVSTTTPLLVTRTLFFLPALLVASSSNLYMNWLLFSPVL